MNTSTQYIILFNTLIIITAFTGASCWGAAWDEEECPPYTFNSPADIYPPAYVSEYTSAFSVDSSGSGTSQEEDEQSTSSTEIQKKKRPKNCDIDKFKHGKKIVNARLLSAAKNGNLCTLIQALDEGADVDAEASFPHDRIDTALSFAATKGHNEIVAALLVRKADVNKVNKSRWAMGYTALIHAANNGHKETVALLLANKAAINGTDKIDGQGRGRTALSYAAAQGRREVVALLLENKADVNQAGEHGWAPLYYAIDRRYGYGLIVKKLLQYKADVNAPDADGRTVLMHIVDHINPFYKKSNQEKVDQLIKARADVNMVDKKGRSALFFAARQRNEILAKQLTKAGANITVALINTIDDGDCGAATFLTELGIKISGLTEDQEDQLEDWGIIQKQGKCMVL